MVEIGVKILLNELGQNVDVGLQLLHPCLVAVRFGDLDDALAQILAQIDSACDRLPALPVLRAGKKLLCKRRRLVDLLQRKCLTVTAVDDVIVHFEVNVLLEVLVELGGSDDVGGNDRILPVMQQ